MYIFHNIDGLKIEKHCKLWAKAKETLLSMLKVSHIEHNN